MKKKLVYLFLIIIAVLSGYYLGIICLNTGEDLIMWLGKSLEFGFETTEINIQVLRLNLGLHFSINFLQILLILIAIVMAPKVSDQIK